MAKRLTAAVGVDVGTKGIKVAIVRLGKDSPNIVGLGYSPTPEGTCDHTGIFDPQAIGKAVQAAVKESGAATKDAIFCINGSSSVVVRILEVPRMSEQELAAHMEWEIQRNIPFAESNVVSDYRPIENPALATTQNMEVVMAVSPQSAIDTIIATSKAAGLKIAAIDVEPLGLARVLKTCHPNDIGAKNLCLIHFGHSTTAINMYRAGTIAFPRTIPIGGAALTKAIADGLGIGMAEAEEKKRHASAPEATPGGFTMPAAGSTATPYTYETAQAAAEGADEMARIRSLLAPPLEELVAEVRRSIDYYRSRGGVVEEIALSGGSANLNGLEQYLNTSLGMPVSKVNPFSNLPVDLRGVGETYMKERASEFSVAVGMGLHIAYD
ncbi:MAG TPA: type IV pilus assembly protein PilM [Fimbriimonadales bacterium]|nr:type IV pilus assembly protein PilM [Fimbriimonadales bacterium]